MTITRCLLGFRLPALFLMTLALHVDSATAQVVPGTGQKVTQVGDDFEDPAWEYIYNLPKSTKNLNEKTGGVGGESRNGRWYEGLKRGQPDVVRRVETPPGGLPGSTGALLLQSRDTGIPGRPSYRLQQDDFICDINYRLGRSIPVSQSPNVVVRVFMPPVPEWEARTGPTFAFRVAVDTTTKKGSGGLFSRSSPQRETYWPGMFIELESQTTTGRDYDSAHFRIRANESGGDYKGMQITTTGWWTLGISCTPDGRIHYYARPGVEPLTESDRMASHLPYGYRAQWFNTFFFNVCSPDDGQTWSTPWIVDDCELFVVSGN
jgi:hypothetical protein